MTGRTAAMTHEGRSPLHLVSGVAALGCLGVLAWLVIPSGEVRCAAAVDASRCFSVATVAPGRYQCTLRSGRPPGGAGLIEQRMLQYERADLVEVRLAPELATGTPVSAGQVVATVRSLHNGSRVAELDGQRDALIARRDLLSAGGRPAEVAAAEQQVRVARAEHATTRAELERLRRLDAAGLVSAADLEVAELEDEVQSLRVALAEAEVEVARAPAQPAALDEVDAQITALDAGMAELDRLLDVERVTSPIDGVAAVGTAAADLEVLELDPVYLHIPLPAEVGLRVPPGTEVAFSTSAAPGESFSGRIEEVATAAGTSQGRSVLWASAAVANPDGRLRKGMTGTVHVPLDGAPVGSVRSGLKRLLWRLQP
jgi:hypothetical protein